MALSGICAVFWLCQMVIACLENFPRNFAIKEYPHEEYVLIAMVLPNSVYSLC